MFAYFRNFIFLIFITSSNAQVLVSIKPIHSLVCAIMQGTHEQPILLFNDKSSPHTAYLLPEQVKSLHASKLIFWIGPSYETNLTKYLKAVQSSLKNQNRPKVISLIMAKDLIVLPLRTGGIWKTSPCQHGHEHNHDHADPTNLNVDGHIWLDPENAKHLAQAIYEELIKIYPHHTSLYRKNLQDLLTRLETLNEQLFSHFQAIHDKPFIVFHDAYQYLEHRYNLKGMGAVRVDPHQESNPIHLKDLVTLLKHNNVKAIFSEPQFSDSSVKKLAQQTELPKGVLDPLGIDFSNGPEAYFEMMARLKDNLLQVLNP